MATVSTKRVVPSLLAGGSLAVLAVLVSMTVIDQRLNNHYALGFFYSLRGQAQALNYATIIGIDRLTVNWLRDVGANAATVDPRASTCVKAVPADDLIAIRGPDSIPRAVYACLVDQLRRLGYPVIALDVLFSAKGDSVEDLALASAIRRHGSAVILVGLERSTVTAGRAELLVEREVQPSVGFAGNAASMGTFVVTRTGGPVYGYWRFVPGFERIRSFPDEAFRLFTGRVPGTPVDRRELLNFQHFWLYGVPGSIETISAIDVLSEPVPADLFAGAARRAAFVGASDPSVSQYTDTFPSFFTGTSGAGISGVELAATAFLNRFPGQRLIVPDTYGTPLLVGLASVFGILACVRSGLAMVVVPVSAVVLFGAAAVAFGRQQIFIPIGTPIFVVAPAAFLLAVIIRYRLARGIILRLAPKTAGRRMLRRGSDRRSAPVSGEATVVFFDLIGSTTIAENLPPVAFSNLLNRYHDIVAATVQKHGGQVIAFSGDGVMAAFLKEDVGANHAERACLSAAGVVSQIGSQNTANAASGLPPLHVRVGVNSGIVAEGEIGAHDRFNFSVVGDVVNLASRLEQLGKSLFPHERDIILVGAAVRDSIDTDELHFVDCGSQEIRGREHPEAVHRLLVA